MHACMRACVRVWRLGHRRIFGYDEEYLAFPCGHTDDDPLLRRLCDNDIGPAKG